MKTDRRVVRTRKAIKEAFDRLLSERDFHKMTVSAIAREADIDRKTFYLHYPTIDDLIRDVAADNIRDIEALLAREGRGKSAPECVHLVLDAVNKTILANIDRYKNIAENLSIDQILERVENNSEFLLEHISFAADAPGLPSDPVQLHLRLRFCLAGALSLYAGWLASDQTIPLSEVSGVVESVLVTNLFND